MKTTYVYLNKYPGGYLYVGSHTWNGPSGVLDSSYHGTSSLARANGWVPISEEILEVVEPSRKNVAERYWIEHYASLYGISDMAYFASKSKSWVERFPKHGLLINMHSNSFRQALDASSSKPVRLRAVESRRNGAGWATNPNLHSRESREKARSTYKLHGNRPTAATIASHTPESIKKMVETRDRMAKRVLMDGVAIKVKDACSVIGCSTYTLYKLYRESESEFKFRGHSFVKLSYSKS